MLVLGGGMAIGLALDMLIVFVFGRTEMADAIILALTPLLLLDMVARESTKFTLLPLFLNLRPERSSKAVSGVHNLFFLLGTLIGVIVAIWSQEVVTLFAPGLSEQAKATAQPLIQVGSLSIPFALGNSVFMVYLNGKESYVPLALRNAIIPAVTLGVFGGLFAFAGSVTEEVVVAGYAIAFVFYFVILFVHAKTYGFEYSVWVLPTTRELKAIYRHINYPVMSFSLRQVLRTAERAIASLVSPGAIIIYYLSFRLFSAITNAVGTSFAVTKAVEINNRVGNNDSAWTTIKALESKLIATGIGGIMGSLLFAEPLLGYFYANGRFGHDSARELAEVFVVMSLGFVFTFPLPALQAAAYAAGLGRVVFMITAICVCLHLGIAYILVGYLGIVGIAAAGVFSVMVEWVMIKHWLRRGLNPPPDVEGRTRNWQVGT